ncbi:hypothetical protein LEP1GSC061_1282 [Leptospira wolffii serovar Khorat str. Khorat-H2]|nr:hypothetical protein LEP1GSC061_1282 [Leptospira wolffii serovar Khorat str. Khorat-H2]
MSWYVFLVEFILSAEARMFPSDINLRGDYFAGLSIFLILW